MPSSRRFALTRIEVLVVAGALVLLASLAVLGGWAWRRAREEARATACRAILERYGQAFAAYTVETKGVLPFESVGRKDEGHVVWYDALEPYLRDAERICPSVDRSAANHQEGYRMNSQLGRSGGLAAEWYRRLDSIPKRDATVLLFDAEYGGEKLSMKGKLKDVGFRHNGSANVLFADWHVERFERNALKEASNWLPPKVIWSVDGEKPGSKP